MVRKSEQHESWKSLAFIAAFRPFPTRSGSGLGSGLWVGAEFGLRLCLYPRKLGNPQNSQQIARPLDYLS